jgi:hypothetical protein
MAFLSWHAQSLIARRERLTSLFEMEQEFNEEQLKEMDAILADIEAMRA